MKVDLLLKIKSGILGDEHVIKIPEAEMDSLGCLETSNGFVVDPTVMNLAVDCMPNVKRKGPFEKEKVEGALGLGLAYPSFACSDPTPCYLSCAPVASTEKEKVDGAREVQETLREKLNRISPTYPSYPSLDCAPCYPPSTLAPTIEKIPIAKQEEEWPEITADTSLKELRKIHERIWDKTIEEGGKSFTQPYSDGCALCEYAIAVCRSKQVPLTASHYCAFCPAVWSATGFPKPCGQDGSLYFTWRCNLPNPGLARGFATLIRNVPFKGEDESE